MTEREEPTPRQILYALVAAGFLVVVAVLVVGAAVAGISPLWWTMSMAGGLVITVVWSAANWRRTAPVLILAIALFLLWTIGTLIVA